MTERLEKWKKGNPDKWRESRRNYARKVRKERPEVVKERRLSWRQRNKEHIRAYQRKSNRRVVLRKYGMTVEEYNLLFESQGGLCGICKKPESENHGVKLSVDHDHHTDKVRALLCLDCNSLLGFAKDSILILESAIRYLEEHND